MPLKRMPTELMLTTRMPPVRPASGVRPLSDPAIPTEPDFDRRPTGPLPRDPDDYVAIRGSENRSQQPAAVLNATAVADYAVHEYYEAAHQETTSAGGYAPAPRPHAPVRESYPPPPPPRRPTPARTHTPARPQPAAASGGYAPASDGLTQLRRQLAVAMENARKHEQRAMEAELRASWAERYVPHLQDPELEQRALRRQSRMRWFKRVLEISCIGLALGGYVSLLIPVRERVIAQDAMIHELTALQQQLRDEKHVLLERIQSMQAPREAETR